MLTCSTRSISPWEPRRTARLRRWNTPLRLNVRCVRNFVLMWTTADWFVKIRSTWNGRWWSGERKPIPSMNWLIISIWAPQRAVASTKLPPVRNDAQMGLQGDSSGLARILTVAWCRDSACRNVQRIASRSAFTAWMSGYWQEHCEIHAQELHAGNFRTVCGWYAHINVRFRSIGPHPTITTQVARRIPPAGRFLRHVHQARNSSGRRNEIPFRLRIDSSKPTYRQNRCCKNGSDHRSVFQADP